MVNFYIYSMDWPVKMLITFVETMLHMWKNVTNVTYVTCHNCNISISNPWDWPVKWWISMDWPVKIGVTCVTYITYVKKWNMLAVIIFIIVIYVMFPYQVPGLVSEFLWTGRWCNAKKTKLNKLNYIPIKIIKWENCENLWDHIVMKIMKN